MHWRVSAEFGVPQLAQVGVALRGFERWEPYLSGGYTPLPVPVSGGLLIASGSVQIGARYHPPGIGDAGLFASLGLGYQNVGVGMPLRLGSLASDVGNPYSFLKVESVNFYPSVGWELKTRTSLTISFELGFQVPLLGGGAIDVQNPSASSAALAASLEQASLTPLAFLGSRILPRATLVRLSWVF